ncbi:unnamed protein product, partial [Brassica rapa subsp. trilocularis]
MRLTACLGICVLRASACGLPIRLILKHRPNSLTCVRVNGLAAILTCKSFGRGGCFVEPSHGIESSKWAIFGKQNLRCGMNRKPGYGAQLRANLEPTKGVGRLRQQDGGHGSRNPLRSVRRGKSQALMRRRAQRSLQNLGREPGRSGRRCRSWCLPTLETAQPEVGSSGWKSTARRVVSGAFPAALENLEDRVPLTLGRTHNRIRSPR